MPKFMWPLTYIAIAFLIGMLHYTVHKSMRDEAVRLKSSYINIDINDRTSNNDITPMPGPFAHVPIYVIMPTNLRLIQKSLLTVQFHLFSRVQNLHLILVEDAVEHSVTLRQLMDKHELQYTHLACSTIEFCKKTNCTGYSGRGPVPRNCGLLWLQEKNITSGVIYFADDDNFYTLELFEEIRKTQKVALFPVGGFHETWISSPLIENGTIVDFIDPARDRIWPIDMAGFSVAVKQWREAGCPKFTYNQGQQETLFVESLKVTRKDIDILADGATKIHVWHNSIRKDVCLKTLPLIKDLDKYKNYQVLKQSILLCQ